MDQQVRDGMKQVLDAVQEAVAVAGVQGVSGGTLYAFLMGQGCTLNTFNAIMGALVRTGKLRQKGNFYFAP